MPSLAMDEKIYILYWASEGPTSLHGAVVTRRTCTTGTLRVPHATIYAKIFSSILNGGICFYFSFKASYQFVYLEAMRR